jgi:hypothetical protein
MTPAYQNVFANLITEICRPQHVPATNPNAELITRLKNMAFDFDMAGQTIYWKTIMDTLDALGANHD